MNLELYIIIDKTRVSFITYSLLSLQYFSLPISKVSEKYGETQIEDIPFQALLFLKHITSTPSQAFLCMFIFLYETTSKLFFWYLDVMFKLKYILDKGLLEIFILKKP